jgi:PAS domain-containing protein
MPQRPIELILMRELAGHLATPIFIVGVDGALLYCNPPAESILGVRFDESGPMPMSEWSTAFQAHDADGRSLDPDRLPLVVALREGQPAHGRFRIRAIDGTVRDLAVTAVPLVGLGADLVGAAALFWEVATCE